MTLAQVFDDNPTITRKQAVRCIREHSADLDQFFAEMGDTNEYPSKDVLEWLGY